jgi:hypothetical protein
LAESTPVDCEPLTDLTPLQSPPALQELALVADQFRVEPVPLFTVLGLALKLIVGADVFTVMLTDCDVLPPLPLQVSV